MSIGLLSGIGGSAAGSPLAQTRGSDVDRAQQDSSAQATSCPQPRERQQAAGVGQADGENHQTNDRDADGRRLWEIPPRKTQSGADAEEFHCPPVQDPTGQSGGTLDVTG